MDIINTKLWLQRISQIKIQQQRLSEVTGLNFNIFETLNIQTSEVRLHSNLIAELLNPKGSHGQRDLYLQLFMKQLDIDEFVTSASNLEVEAYIGPINEDYTSGGRVDIAITDSSRNQIYIENKIYAYDQKNQLLRYYNNNNKALIFYLTLDGGEPSVESTGVNPEKGRYRCISYSNDIIEWLLSCKKESASLPIIRETLTQYIHLIKSLTGQLGEIGVQKEIEDLLIENPDLVDAINQCHSVLQSMLNKSNDKFKKCMNEHFKNLEIELQNGISIIPKWGEDGDGVHIGYQAFRDGNNISKSSEVAYLIAMLKEINSDFKSGGPWLGWINPQPFRHRERYKDLQSSDVFKYNKEPVELNNFVEGIEKQEQEFRKEFESRLQLS